MNTQTKYVSWWHWHSLALVAAILVPAWLLSLWPTLQQARWWYPEAGFREIWTLYWVGLYAVSIWRRNRHGALGWGLQGLWILTLILAFSAWFNLLQYIHAFFTTGDLHFNHFRGAQRAYQGVAVYDMRGLYQSVNASPFVIGLLRPWGWMKTREFLPGWLLCHAALLLLYFLYCWRWIHWLWQGLPTHSPDATSSSAQTVALSPDPVSQHEAKNTLHPVVSSTALPTQTTSPGLPEFGIIVITTLFFNSFQRSWRLGQLDLWILLLVAAGSFHLCWYLLRRDHPVVHGVVGMVLLVSATGSKLVPGLLFGPLVLWIFFHRVRFQASPRSVLCPVLVGGGLGVALVLGVSWWGVGTQEMSRFARNLQRMSQGSTAGVNHALVGRFAKYRDPKLRQRHHPLPPQDRRWLWPLRIAVGLMWLWLAWIATPVLLPFLLWLGLASLPLLSPMCWDIYFIWCANFPWLMLWAWIGGPFHHLWSHTPVASGTPWVSAATKRWLAVCGLGSAFYLMGLAGNSVIRDIHTMKLVDLNLPLWFDEARMLGYLLLMGLLVWVLWASAPTCRDLSSVSQVAKV